MKRLQLGGRAAGYVMGESRLQLTVIIGFMLASLILLIVADGTGTVMGAIKFIACSVMASGMAVTLVMLARRGGNGDTTK